MPALKFTFISSFYAKTPTTQSLESRFVRSTTIATTTKPPGWRITPCAPFRAYSPAQDKAITFKKLEFRGLQSSSGYKGGALGGGGGGGESVGSGLLNMGSENNNKDDQWLENDCSPTSTLPSHNHHKDQIKKKAAVAPPETPSRHQSNKLLTLPTILTIGRVAAVPILVCTFYMNSWLGTTATTSIFIAAAITDWLDGYLARKMKLGSAFGAFLDPVADKLMVAATLVLLCTRPPEVAIFGQFPWLLTVPSIAIIGREITMSAVREWAASQNTKLSEAVAVNSLGKWKTATQMTALTILLVTRDGSLAGPGVLVASGVALLYISAWLAVWSLFVYMKKIWKVLLM